MASLQDNSRELRRAIVIGSSGGIGAALAKALGERGLAVTGLSRSHGDAADGSGIDITDEASIASAAARLVGNAPFDIIIVATGLLHNANVAPEKTYRNLRTETLLDYFAVNSVGPALVAKHFIPLLPRKGRCVFAALSARVGSISDNRLGGWYGYRASKAALNMLVKTLAIEVRRTRSDAVCVGLHPGTVDTKLSKPFQRRVPRERLFTAEQSAASLVDVIERLTPAQSGDCFAWDGARIRP
ncbi:SDR family NAD(P)-dependent oxidoreductase [Sphingomonas edaphi]|uniref:SDR family NAD(P)-dependent oxidoreductase n=1 Tax=Sphingomonas edaphi TaxID=2315689 RepID=A0A418Q2N3_9SPHN|nr:SDR family NAD(P)-dependent oxidoreductase [Sphingomonas edaphi]RIX32218.1 SDR family NAD(P)-dependent oxidoreductase [Sphingomonas edaphi]